MNAQLKSFLCRPCCSENARSAIADRLPEGLKSLVPVLERLLVSVQITFVRLLDLLGF